MFGVRVLHRLSFGILSHSVGLALLLLHVYTTYGVLGSDLDFAALQQDGCLFIRGLRSDVEVVVSTFRHATSICLG